MAKPTNKDVTDEFIIAFENGNPFTISERKLMGIQLSQLRKTVKEYIESAEIETDLTLNEIIIDAIQYGVISGKKWRRISSIAYGNTIRDSIKFWETRRKIIKDKENKKTIENENKIVEKVIENSYNNNIEVDVKKRPKWIGKEDEW